MWLLLLCLIVQGWQGAGTTELPLGSCAFEDSACAYESTFAFLPWVLNEDGHYISVDTSFGAEGEKAVLVSPDLQPEDWSCIRLIYQISGSDSITSQPSKLNVYVRPEGQSYDYLLWSSKEYSDSWLIASIDLRNTTHKFKIVLEGILGEGATASIAIFEIKLTTEYCIECDFEENHLCGYTNRWNPNVNWFVGGGNIRNSQSILPRDHTLNNEQGHYMYVDSVYIKHFQEVAQLVSPMIQTPLSGCLSFYYHLQRKNSNVFTIHTRDINGFYEEIWKMENAITGDWNLAEVDITAPYPLEVIFEVAFNGIHAGHIAIDDISFSPEYCKSQTGTLFDAAEVSCNFEDDLCNFHQDRKDGSGWNRVKVKPNLYRTGDHTTGLGYFMLANTRFTSQSGYFGRLYGPSLPGGLQYCLRFYYALHGFSKMSDSLAVYIFEENHVVQEKIWSVLESSKGIWLQAEISIYKPMPCQIVFVSWCKSFWDCGLVALDDVALSVGDCRITDMLPSPPGQCTFEKNECGYTQVRRNKSSWHKTRGETPTSYTGPKGDHTTGVGYYMYIEASNMIYGEKARLYSQSLRAIPGQQCLTFFYHMYGAGTGLLNVYMRKEGSGEKETLLWRRRGEQSITWLRGVVEYECKKHHQIIFEAIRGASIRSDIAIDDIMIRSGPCEEKEEVLTWHSSGFSEDINEIEY
uniref:MAM domain-containing protein 2 isoform X1 n=1 Tax=Geotrypetes seraphini TaxID=260995 RepID=A0A6P8Q0L4_GEOSA|nr:MAM domain-containing protein 2 isoform X1 [Geotrypetes seraphini]